MSSSNIMSYTRHVNEAITSVHTSALWNVNLSSHAIWRNSVTVCVNAMKMKAYHSHPYQQSWTRHAFAVMIPIDPAHMIDIPLPCWATLPMVVHPITQQHHAHISQVNNTHHVNHYNTRTPCHLDRVWHEWYTYVGLHSSELAQWLFVRKNSIEGRLHRILE